MSFQAAKLDPQLGCAFRYLGHYYREVSQDLGRARGCYKKAFDLDDSDAESGAAAVDLSMESNDMVCCLALLLLHLRLDIILTVPYYFCLWCRSHDFFPSFTEGCCFSNASVSDWASHPRLSQMGLDETRALPPESWRAPAGHSRVRVSNLRLLPTLAEVFFITTACLLPLPCSLQAALRADPGDWVCWECLGDAYLNRRSFTAALKAFGKAQQLQPSSIYSVYQAAAIKQTLGKFKEAVAEYLQITAQQDYVPALKGTCE